MARHDIRSLRFSVVYPLYLAKAERKGRTKEEVDRILTWLTGYGSQDLERLLQQESTFETFFAECPRLNPARKQITGTVCGVRVETIDDPLVQEIRYLDKLIDELAKGRPMEKILRNQVAGT
jgi:hypothetical protein